ncbi:splicing factor 3B subunit 5/RDS3 complex subunit 10 [Hyaloraphidium curvatum]|nr:splicing factor 3B subunit 5/RDS3 complex subunit 10 [Hyaloraphidium curvatum]
MERGSVQSQLEHLQSKFVGTGHADTNKYEFVTNQHRDSYASYIGHRNLIGYFAIAENESIGRMKFNFLEKCLAPTGLPVPED